MLRQLQFGWGIPPGATFPILPCDLPGSAFAEARNRVSFGYGDVRKGRDMSRRDQIGSCEDSYAAAKVSVSSSQARTRPGACGRHGSPTGRPRS